jgi:S-adenosylmethionine:tRNA ribosyltransferase-isomerase
VFSPSDYTFELPPELIAQEPAAQRDASRLLHVAGDRLEDRRFDELPSLLPADSVLVANDTRVIPARVLGHKASGGAVEFLFLEPELATPAPAGTSAWRCLAKARRALRPGQTVRINNTEVDLTILTDRADDGSLAVAAPGDGLAFLDAHGHIPLPHYIDHGDTPADRERYQTMFATVPGAVAAPTAGLHMTPAIADAMRARGITLTTVTLHVGWGTFAPIRVDDIRTHRMHRERYVIPPATAALVASGRPIVALGTTALRALEAAPLGGHSGATELFIYPGSGHTFRVDHLVTNFHLPESTLLMLVCAFAGTDRVLAAYRHAVAQRYRFFSYGDASLLHRV